MNQFEMAKECSARKHAEWSAKQRTLLAGDRSALAAVIKSGAVYNLTKEDREELIDLYGEAPPRARRIPGPEPRQPLPIAAASLPASQRQSWVEGEFAHALTKAALAWGAVVVGANIVLIFLSWKGL